MPRSPSPTSARPRTAAASDSEPDLFRSPLPDQDLVVIAGKGGVGRSTVAAGLALACASAGEKVLLVDAVDHGGTRLALGDRRLTNGGQFLELDTTTAMDEYIRLFLKFPIPPSRLGPIARIFDYVATAAPGVTEILTIGKIVYEVQQADFDRVIVDSPATGHVVELLAAPENLEAVVGLGPIAQQSAGLTEVLADPARTGVWLVTTAEELPVTETLMLADRIRAETDTALAGAIANRLPPSLDRSGVTEAERLSDHPTDEDGPGADAAVARAAAIALRQHTVRTGELDRFSDAWAGTGLPLRSVGYASDPTEAARRMWSGLE